MEFVSFIRNDLLVSSEYEELIKLAKVKQIAATIEKIDKFNQAHDIIIRQVEREHIISVQKKKMQALKNAGKFTKNKKPT